MILHGEGEVRACDLPVRLFELLQCVGRVKLMQNMAVDVDQLTAVHAARHPSPVPKSCRTGSLPCDILRHALLGLPPRDAARHCLLHRFRREFFARKDRCDRAVGGERGDGLIDVGAEEGLVGEQRTADVGAGARAQRRPAK